MLPPPCFGTGESVGAGWHLAEHLVDGIELLFVRVALGDVGEFAPGGVAPAQHGVVFALPLQLGLDVYKRQLYMSQSNIMN